VIAEHPDLNVLILTTPGIMLPIAAAGKISTNALMVATITTNPDGAHPHDVGADTSITR